MLLFSRYICVFLFLCVSIAFIFYRCSNLASYTHTPKTNAIKETEHQYYHLYQYLFNITQVSKIAHKFSIKRQI